MKDDNYLWDRTGEVDPEVQELEEVLGTLRYQQRPLRIPADIQIGRRRTFYPPMAIAAAIALIALALGIWFSLSRQQAAQPLQASADSPIKQAPIAPGGAQSSPGIERVVEPDSKPATKPSSPGSPRNLVAENRSRRIRREIRQPELTPQELAEKEQLVAALRLVSVKLNIAQRRMQGPSPQNVIRNHRIG